MKHILFLGFLFLFGLSFGQTEIWSEDFENTSANWNLNISTGQNDSDANLWEISDNEGGVIPPGCGVAGNGNKTLHVTCQGSFCIGTGALYNAGDGGLGFFASTTNKRAALTTPISTIGQTQLSVSFDWIGVGESGLDYTVFEYSIDGGITWDILWTQTPGATCSGGQGQWATQTMPMPSDAENILDLRFAFTWTNDNNGAGTDPSFAVDNVRLFTDDPIGTPPPVADFSASQTTICIGECIDFTDESTGDGLSWNWAFNGADVSSSTEANPTNICYSEAGTFTVTLEVTNDGGTDTKEIQITVTDCSTPTPPSADFSASQTNICIGECINFTDASSGDGLSWNWTFDGADTPTSTTQNPTNICYSAAGTYSVTLEVTNADGTDTKTLQITVSDCSTPTPPTANFTASQFSICEGECINFTDLSTGGPTSWSWTFNGANTPSSTTQNPTNICYSTAGTYDVTLEVTNADGTDIKTLQIAVSDCNSPTTPTANFVASEVEICVGECIDFTDLSSGGVTEWNWIFNGSSTPFSTEQNPTNICYSQPGVYNVILKAINEFGTDTKTIQIVVSNCTTGVPPTAVFAIDTTLVCDGDCISFIDKSTGNPTSWEWNFDGGDPNTSNQQNPSKVCFNEPGVYNITLTVSNDYGTDQTVTAINVLELPTITAHGDTTLNMNGTAYLWAEPDPNEPGLIYWEPTEFLSCSECIETEASPYFNTLYISYLEGLNGCIGSDTVLILVNFRDVIDVPSAFSPNGDGVNDFIRVLGPGITSIDFKIYNRYGQLVFETTDPKDKWDGTLNGKPFNQGVFVYTLWYTLEDNTIHQKTGNITLIK